MKSNSDKTPKSQSQSILDNATINNSTIGEIKQNIVNQSNSSSDDNVADDKNEYNFRGAKFGGGFAGRDYIRHLQQLFWQSIKLKFSSISYTLALIPLEKLKFLEISIGNVHHHYHSNQPEEVSKTENTQSAMNQLNEEKEVFISYAWGGESETMAYALEKTCQAKEIKTFKTVRDKQDVKYKDLIVEFMQRLGRGKAIVIIISKKYLESQYCMFELLEIAKNGEFYERIFPIVLQDSKIYDIFAKIDYINHWQNREDELNEKVKSIKSSANIQGITEELSLYANIRGKWDELIDVISKMNNLSPEKHLESNFAQIIDAIENRINNP